MKNILLILCIFCLSTSYSIAQDKLLKVALKDAAKSDVYIDGKKYDQEILELLDQSKIESVEILKDKKAIEKYNAPNGVIFIKTKKFTEGIVSMNGKGIKIRGVDINTKKFPGGIVSMDDKGVKIRGGDKEPMVIIDGKVADKKTLSELSPADIESINVIKGEKAIAEYNALNGVIVVKTKR